MSLVDTVAAIFDPVSEPRLAAAHNRLMHAKREIDAASLAAEQREHGAEKRLDRARAAVTEAELEVDRIERARRYKAEQETAAIARKQAEARQHEQDVLRAGLVELKVNAMKADEALGRFVEAVAAVRRSQDVVLAVAHDRDRQIINDANEWFWACVTWRLKFMPGVKLAHPLMDPARAEWAGHFADVAPTEKRSEA